MVTPKPSCHPTQCEIWAVRHGQTDWNLEGRYQGQTDVPLNTTGIEQAKHVAASLDGHHFAAIYSSDLKRAHDTALILAARVHCPVIVDPRLREIHQGEWEGMQFSEVVARFPHHISQRQEQPLQVRPPGGESVLEVAQRMAAAANDIASRHPGQRVLLVSHGLAIATLIVQASHFPFERVFSLIPDNASITVICWPPSVG
ncbi:alpha-ribazole phosphatase [uncultured Thermanaerothrix sp.]|uniref:alpha-ribazole phosphatase n=1 Tax=uncultured Thermanaerothrix sp. TaxID=1195149 RepID=UPI00261F393D|nr:alpha-ribazole phosphatase [uncultured Thermanaerothrix sp.]